MIIADTFARVLAALSLFVGAIGATGSIVALLSYRRDRPQLRLTWSVVAGADRPMFELTVINDGRRPTTLARVQIQNHAPPRGGIFHWRRLATRLSRGQLRFGLRSGTGEGFLPENAESAPKLLNPGESCAFTFDIEKFASLPAREGRYAYAVDVVGRSAAVRLTLRDMEMVAGISRAISQAKEGSS